MTFLQNLISDICDNLLLSKMSHQTGIGASDSLRQFFGKCRDGQYRVVKVYYFALDIIIFIYIYGVPINTGSSLGFLIIEKC